VEPSAFPLKWVYKRLRSVDRDADRPLAGGSLGEMPMYSKIMPPIEWQSVLSI